MSSFLLLLLKHGFNSFLAFTWIPLSCAWTLDSQHQSEQWSQWTSTFLSLTELFMENGYDHHDHQDRYTYNLSGPKRFTLDVPNQSPLPVGWTSTFLSLTKPACNPFSLFLSLDSQHQSDLQVEYLWPNLPASLSWCTAPKVSASKTTQAQTRWPWMTPSFTFASLSICS